MPKNRQQTRQQKVTRPPCPCCTRSGRVRSVGSYRDERGDTLRALVDLSGRVWIELTDRGEMPAPPPTGAGAA
jgi:hypothetical protein